MHYLRANLNTSSNIIKKGLVTIIVDYLHVAHITKSCITSIHVVLFVYTPESPLEFDKNAWTFYFAAGDTELSPKNVKIRWKYDARTPVKMSKKFTGNSINYVIFRQLHEKWHLWHVFYTLVETNSCHSGIMQESQIMR